MGASCDIKEATPPLFWLLRFSYCFPCAEERRRKRGEREREASRIPRRCPANQRDCYLAPALPGSTETTSLPGTDRRLATTSPTAAFTRRCPTLHRHHRLSPPGLSSCNHSKRIERPTNIIILVHSDPPFCSPEVRALFFLRE